MLRWILSVLLVMFSLGAFAADNVYVLDISGTIGPATVDYVKRGLNTAEKHNATALVLKLNTPGGLNAAMRSINAILINSPIPVIAYVAPSGAKALNAGLSLVYGAAIAAMAPNTTIGANGPPQPFMLDTRPALKSLIAKQTEDRTTYIRGLADLHQRNAQWAADAIRSGHTINNDEATQLHVINLTANSVPDLLQKIDQQTVQVNGIPQRLHTSQSSIQDLGNDWRYTILSFITNPTIAYLLLLLAIYGLIFELAHPGLVVPGIIGIVCFLLAFYALQIMPLNPIGLTLILVGILFMTFEVYVSTFGLIGLAGIITFTIGSLLLFDTTNPYYELSKITIAVMSLLSAIFFLVILKLAFRSQEKPVTTGKEAMIGAEAVVLNVMGRQIIVRVFGETWEAQSTQPLTIGQKVRVRSIRGLLLHVDPIETVHKD